MIDAEETYKYKPPTKILLYGLMCIFMPILFVVFGMFVGLFNKSIPLWKIFFAVFVLIFFLLFGITTLIKYFKHKKNKYFIISKDYIILPFCWEQDTMKIKNNEIKNIFKSETNVDDINILTKKNIVYVLSCDWIEGTTRNEIFNKLKNKTCVKEATDNNTNNSYTNSNNINIFNYVDIIDYIYYRVHNIYKNKWKDSEAWMYSIAVISILQLLIFMIVDALLYKYFNINISKYILYGIYIIILIINYYLCCVRINYIELEKKWENENKKQRTRRGWIIVLGIFIIFGSCFFLVLLQ